MVRAQSRLLADVGGTKVRLAWQDHAQVPITDLRVLRVADHVGLAEAVAHYLASGGHPRPRAAALGVASPITGDDTIDMTNSPWSFSRTQLKQALGVERLVVVNDFVALAMALPRLPDQHLLHLGGGTADADAPRVVMGPGTGLGVATLARTPAGKWLPIPGEGGHATLAPENDLEAAVAAWLVRRFGHAALEFVLSGQGLVNLHDALADIDGLRQPARDAVQISAAAEQGDPWCTHVRNVFLGLLGSAAGNMALNVTATGGVYLGGGILPRWRSALVDSPLRERFEAKGSYQALLARIPLMVIVDAEAPALLGAAALLD